MQLVVTKSNTLNALSWIKQGWRLFTLQPGPFMAMSAIIIAFTFLANINAIFGVIVVFMMPFLSAGFYQCASRADQGESITASDIFYYFSHLATHRVFIRLAFISIVLSIPSSQLALNIQEALLAGEMFDVTSAILLVVLLWLNFMLLGFTIPAAWIAPETSVLILIKQSFHACWVNAIPLSLYGLVLFVLALISSPIILVGWLIMYAVSTLSFYQMFLSIYQPVQTVGTEVSEAQDIQSETESSEDTKNDGEDEKDKDNETVSKNNTPDN
jgi:ABC-type multidrug transport system fused ATPase/permease subunit